MIKLKKIFAILYFSANALAIAAQAIEINLLHALHKEPIADAHLTIIPLTRGAKSFSAISNHEGKVLLSLSEYPEEKFFFVKITHASFENHTDTVTAGKPDTIYLQPVVIPLDEVVVTASFSPVASNRSPYNVTIIKEESVLRRGAINLKDVLKQQLNVRLSQDAILGTSLALQGLGGQQVKILIDGVPVIGRINGNIDISQLNLNDAERIEIIEGPVSIQYGTNALGGVVNIITKNSTEKFNINLNSYYESVGQYNIDGSIGMNHNRHALRLSAGRYFFDGFSDPDTSRVKQWDPKEQYFAALKYSYKIKEIQLTYTSNIFRELIENRGARRPLLYISAFDDYYRTIRFDNAITAKGKLFKNHYLDKVVAYNFFERKKNTFLKDLTTLEKVLTLNPEDHDTSRFTNLLIRGVIVRDNKQHWFNYQIGYDINYETGKGKRIEGGKKSIGDYAFFFNFMLQPITMLALQPGMRWSYNTAYPAPISPILNIKLQPLRQIIIRTSYARGFRAPDMKELYFQFVDINHNITGNPELKAETSHNFNFNVQYAETFASKHFFKIQPSYFLNDIKNNIFLVITDFVTNTAQNINIGHYRTMGTQAVVQYTYNRNLNITLGLNYTGRRFDFDTTSSSYFFSPEVSAEISYTIPKTDVNISLFNKWNGKLTTLALQENKLVQQELKQFNTLDVSMSRFFWKKRLLITAGVKNMLNVTNIAARGYAGGFHGGSTNSAIAGWGRTIFISLRFNFEKT
jgi:outer membrane receptor for ferrienterochelin and colicins